jgi:hypothetical protein
MSVDEPTLESSETWKGRNAENMMGSTSQERRRLSGQPLLREREGGTRERERERERGRERERERERGRQAGKL